MVSRRAQSALQEPDRRPGRLPEPGSRDGAAMRFFRLLFALALSLPMLAACATPPPASQPEALADYRETNDPLEPTNRVIYEVSNDIADITLTPAARAYRWALPEGVRNSVS